MTTKDETARITVDLPMEDYDALKVAAALAGRGQSMSSLVRRLVRLFVRDDDDELQDAFDQAVVRFRRDDPRPWISADEVKQRVARLRADLVTAR
jgi:Arc/MetJ-type ribon-helix-helix transcriptional regulator